MPNESRRRGVAELFHNEVTAWVVLGVSLLVTVLGWYIADAYVERRANDRFLFEVEDARGRIGKRMLDYEQVLRGGVALIDMLGRPVSRQEWRDYVSGLRIQTYFPGIQGIGYATLVEPQALDAHVAAVRGEGFPDYRVRPAGERAIYSAIVYLEPFDWRNRRAFGYDMFSEPVRRAAMERARDSGLPAVSGRVVLVQETEEDVQAGFLMYLPVYRPGMPRASVQERRRAIAGFVYSPFRVDDLMRGILGSDTPALGFELFDGSAQPAADTLLYASDPVGGVGDYRPRRTLTTTLDLRGRTWTARFHSRPQFDRAMASSQPELVALGGLMVDILLFSIIWSLARQRKRVEAKAAAMTGQLQEANRRRGAELAERERAQAALRDSQARYATLFEAIADAVYVHEVGPDGMPGRFFEANGQACRYTGYSRDELLTMSPLDLDAPDSGTAPGPVVEKLLTGGSVAFEQVHVRKDGSRVPVEIHADLFELDGRCAVVSIVRDITERRHVQEELHRLNATLEQRVREEVEKNLDKERLLIQQSRLAAMGEMIGNIAHQWRQPINALGLLLANIEDAYEFGELDGAYIEREVAKGTRLVQQMSTTIDDFRNFFRPDKARQPFALSRVIDETLHLLGQSLDNHGIRVEVVRDTAVRVCGYPNELSQVLVNLVTNAKDALLEHGVRPGRIAIEMGRDGPNARLSVRDNAGGIPAAILAKVFDPYFTTKEKGTGIGLYMSEKIVEHMGGSISAESGDGQTCFTIHLPMLVDRPCRESDNG